MVLNKVKVRVQNAGTLISSGMIRPPRRPGWLVKSITLLRKWGPTPALGYSMNAMRHPGETALIDELGALTFEEVHLRTNRLAHALADAGISEGQGIGIMCRNHRGFVEATIAASKLGANALYLNTAFSGPQINDVVKREDPKALIFDEEFAGLIGDAADDRLTFLSWVDPEAESPPVDDTLERLIARGDPSDVVPPAEPGRVVILTSGTTGTPKGATRSQPKSLDPAAALLSKIPLKARETTMIAAPLFHSWGFAHFTLGMGLAATIVLKRKFDPEETLAATAEHRATTLVVVPIMLQRILDLPEATLHKYDLRALKVIALSGSALQGAVSTKAMDTFGDVAYNLYGSTEVAWATIATPRDLRDAPGTAGRPPRGTIVKIYDEQERECPTGTTGRIFVGNEMMFEGYTGGGSKAMIGELMATGDVGHFDEKGLLHVDGRDDDMIVSGGENVFPQEVEELLAGYQGIGDVAVVGVSDDEWGQRLRAFVVAKGKQPSEAELKQHIKDNLASYKVPRDWVFLDELPRNATGKVLKRELKEYDTA